MTQTISFLDSYLGLVIGNSRLHWAWFVDGKLHLAWDSPHLSPTAVHQLIARHFDFNAVLENPPNLPIPQFPNFPLYIASVVPAQTLLWQAYPQSRVLTLGDVPLQGPYPTLGIDRALALLGAVEILGCPALVIDAGTALTFTGIDSTCCLVGGAILPGLGLQFSTLAQKTAALPWVRHGVTSLGQSDGGMGLPDRWAINTPDAIQSGIIYTMLAGLRDFVSAWHQQFPTSGLVLTGGDAEFLMTLLRFYAPELAGDIQLESHLIFRGLQGSLEKDFV